MRSERICPEILIFYESTSTVALPSIKSPRSIPQLLPLERTTKPQEGP